jgi:hypothetical protein
MVSQKVAMLGESRTTIKGFERTDHMGRFRRSEGMGLTRRSQGDRGLGAAHWDSRNQAVGALHLLMEFRRLSAGGLPLRFTKEVQGLFHGHRGTRRTLIRTESEYLDVSVTSLSRTVVAGQDHEMGTANALRGLCSSHQGALIGGSAIGETAFRYRDAKNPSTDWFVG